MKTEVWAKGKQIRTISVQKRDDLIDMRLSWATSPGVNSFAREVEMFGLSEATLAVISVAGSERWYYSLPREAALKKISDFKKRAVAAGFEKVGGFTA